MGKFITFNSKGWRILLKEVKELLGNFFDKNFLTEGEEYLEFKTHWQKIVGDDLASHIFIDDLVDKRLIVKADHQGWAQLFLMKKKAILKKINSIFPQMQIRNIQIKYKDNIVKQNEEVQKVSEKIEEKIVVKDDDFADILNKFKERSESES